MKKVFGIFLVVAILLLTGCSDYEPPKPVTADMLTILNDKNSYIDCRERFESVMQAVENKTRILEKEYNQKIIRENPNDYFLNESYLLSTFDPFNLERLNYTDSFNDEYTQEIANEEFTIKAGSKTIIYTSEKNAYKLKFVEEELTEIYLAQYDKKHDSFRYSYINDTPEGEETVEFLEFITISDTEYAIQSNKSRLYVKFDAEGNIIYFISSTLRNENYEPDDTIYDNHTTFSEGSAEKWATGLDEEKYANIRVFEDGYLTHKDFVSSPTVEVSIKAEDYASAFYF